MSKNSYGTYIVCLMSFIVLILGICASWNWLVDPYDMFGNPRIEGINLAKPNAESRERISKPYRILDVRPRTLILGNSRPELGLDPSYQCWPEAMQPVYNMAMLGTGLYEHYRNLQHAVHQGQIRHLFLALDFLFFVGPDEPVNSKDWSLPNRDLEQLQVFAHGDVNTQFEWNRLINRLKAIFSLQALIDSIHTVLVQKNPNTPTINQDGYNPGYQYLDGIAIEGQQVFFEQKNREVAMLLAKKNMVFRSDQRWSEPFELLGRILMLANTHDIQVTLFINPRHADFLSLILLSDKWTMMEDWKRVLINLATKHQAQVWDFHDFDEFSMPPAPTEIGKSLKGFWEPGHYRRELGNVMINRMVNTDCAVNTPIIGTRLQLSEIEAHLKELQQRRQTYIRTHHMEFNALKELYDKAGGSGPNY